MKDPEKDQAFRRKVGAGELAKQDRTESNEALGAGKKHVPRAQLREDEQGERAPGVEEHDAAGQGLSG